MNEKEQILNSLIIKLRLSMRFKEENTTLLYKEFKKEFNSSPESIKDKFSEVHSKLKEEVSRS